MAGIDENFLEEIKAKNDIVDIISSYVDLRRYGDTHKGLCPFHNEKTPSFIVNERKQFFKCFGCGEGGDVISFIMKRENLDFIQALQFLAERGNIPWPQEEMSKEQQSQAKKRDLLIRIHTDTARFYFTKLWANTDDALSYIRKRGLCDQTIKRFGLGYAPKDRSLYSFLKQRGYEEEDLLESGIFTGKKEQLRERFFSRLIFPIFDLRGRVIAFGGRVMDDSQPKYLNSPETLIFQKKDNLYALNIVKNHSKSGILLVEGYMDVISLHEHGFPFAVASLGTALSKEQTEKLKRYSHQIYIAYDSDEAGKKATLRAIEIFEQQHMYPYIVHMEEYKDPDEYIKKKGEKNFQRQIDASRSALQFINDSKREQYDLNYDKDQMEFIKEVTAVLKKHRQNAVEVEKEIIRISEMTGISIKALGTEVYGEYFSPKQFKHVELGLGNYLVRKEEIPISAQNKLEMEYLLLYNLFRNRELEQHLSYPIREEDFSTVETKRLFHLFSQKLMIDIVDIDEFRGNNVEYSLLSEEQIQSIARVLHRTSVKAKIADLQQRQRQLNISEPENHQELLEIGMQIMELNKDMKNM